MMYHVWVNVIHLGDGKWVQMYTPFLCEKKIEFAYISRVNFDQTVCAFAVLVAWYSLLYVYIPCTAAHGELM